MKTTLISIGSLILSAVAAQAGEGSLPPAVTDNGATAGVILLLAIGAILLLKGGAGASTSEKRNDQLADEE